MNLFAPFCIKTEGMHFAAIHRLPRISTNPYTAEQQKSIVVKSVCLNNRNNVYQASKKLISAATREEISVRTDILVKIKKYRRKLATKANNLRQNKKLQTRILAKGTDITLQIRKTRKTHAKFYFAGG